MDFVEYIKKNIISFDLITESTNRVYEFKKDGKNFILKHCRQNEKNLSRFWYMMKKLFCHNFAKHIARLDILYKNLSNEYVEIAKPVYADPVLKYHAYSKIEGESYSPDIFLENKNILTQLGKFIGFTHQKKYENYGAYNTEKNNFSNNLIETIAAIIKKYHKNNDEIKKVFDRIIKTNRVVRQPSGFEQLPFENAISQPKGREIAGTVRQPTGLSNKSNFALIMPDISANQFVYSADFENINGLVDFDAYVIGPVEMELTVIELCLPNEASARYFKSGYEQFNKLPPLENKRDVFRFLTLLCGCENDEDAELIMNKKRYWK